MDTPGSVTRLCLDLRSDDPVVREAAARLIWQRYFRELLALARNHLSERIRRRADEEDVLQSMFQSFVARQTRESASPAPTNRDNLWRLLVTITLRKVRNAANHHRREKRDVGREQAAARDEEGPHWDLEAMEAAGPTPVEAAILTEALERRLAALDDPVLRDVALKKLEGHTNSEIARQRGCTERTIERKVERIKAKWASYQEPAV